MCVKERVRERERGREREREYPKWLSAMNVITTRGVCVLKGARVGRFLLSEVPL